MAFQSNNLYDSTTDRYVRIDNFNNLRTAEAKRIVGSNFGTSIDTTYLYTTTLNAAGTATASNAEAVFATGTTANGSASMVSKAKIRTLSGRVNLMRSVIRFGDTGTTNNVREFGIYSDANNQFVFRLSGTTFSVVTKRAGVETAVSSGSFNGNGTSSSQTYTVDTNYHTYEIYYNSSRIEFIIDGVAIHSVRATVASITGSILGQLYISNTNSGGSTTNVSLYLLTWSGIQIGDAVNNPLFYNIDAVAETRTLKSGGGTLQAVTIGRLGGANALITIYDSLTGSGTKIATFDLTANSAFGTHTMAIEGVNFYNGLTYVTSGTMTNGSVTIFWE